MILDANNFPIDVAGGSGGGAEIGGCVKELC